MLAKRTVSLDGITYTLAPITFADDLEIEDESIVVNTDGGVTGIKMNTGTMQLKKVVKSIKSWTFRGFDAEGNLSVDASVSILPITEENIKKLPSRHGVMLRKVCSEINDLTKDELKKL